VSIVKINAITVPRERFDMAAAIDDVLSAAEYLEVDLCYERCQAADPATDQRNRRRAPRQRSPHRT
jgi:hypothetical protein